MSARGFTLVELLVALVLTLVVAAAALLLAQAAGTSLAVEPVAMDTAGRVRETADIVAAALASAGGTPEVGEWTGPIGAFVPVVRLLTPSGDAFTGLSILRVVAGGRGRLAADQSDPGGSLTLEAGTGVCPGSAVVCGFAPGDVAVVFDARGHHDLFVVAAVVEGWLRLVPSAPLQRAYRTGAWVVEVRHERFDLTAQADGSQVLQRTTGAGARQPVVDGVTRVEFVAWGRAAAPALYDAEERLGVSEYGLPPPLPDEMDPDGVFPAGAHCMTARVGGLPRSPLGAFPEANDGLARLAPSALDDGPWCPDATAADRFDADWFRVRRVDVWLALEALAPELRGSAGVLFARAGTAGHAPRAWVPDRHVAMSVAVP